jgi:flavin reductase (DIM6/NTAB) family NADH-FMN oxidoreductase RutF
MLMDGSHDMLLRDRFVDAMAQVAYSVSVVTTDGPHGLSGVTVSAMTSVSADTPKPTLLVCVNHKSSSAAIIAQNGLFCVNVLSDRQSPIADVFAGRGAETGADKFNCAGWTPMGTGAPRLVDPLLAFDCRLVSDNRVGTHHVFVGAVEDLFIADTGEALVYARRAYARATALPPD